MIGLPAGKSTFTVLAFDENTIGLRTHLIKLNDVNAAIHADIIMDGLFHDELQGKNLDECNKFFRNLCGKTYAYSWIHYIDGTAYPQNMEEVKWQL